MYRVYSINLTAITPAAGTEVVSSSQRMAEVDILSVPANTTIELAFGATADFFIVDDKFYSAPKGEDVQSGSLRYRNLVAQPGVVLQLIVSFDTGILAVAP